tara:strand:- start:312 stop:515 length:204 start_codon:yes stop_codon:yes gene_type:complete
VLIDNQKFYQFLKLNLNNMLAVEPILQKNQFLNSLVIMYFAWSDLFEQELVTVVFVIEELVNKALNN